jgi:hypothetical protein
MDPFTVMSGFNVYDQPMYPHYPYQEETMNHRLDYQNLRHTQIMDYGLEAKKQISNSYPPLYSDQKGYYSNAKHGQIPSLLSIDTVTNRNTFSTEETKNAMYDPKYFKTSGFNVNSTAQRASQGKISKQKNKTKSKTWDSTLVNATRGTLINAKHYGKVVDVPSNSNQSLSPMSPTDLTKDAFSETSTKYFTAAAYVNDKDTSHGITSLSGKHAEEDISPLINTKRDDMQETTIRKLLKDVREPRNWTEYKALYGDVTNMPFYEPHPGRVL